MTDRWDLPDEKDVEDSGVGDWLDRAMAEQQRRNRSLSGMLGDTREELEKRKQGLSDLLNTPVEGTAEEEPPAPDLFEQERAEQERTRRGMAGFVEEERRRKEQERDALRDMFGSSDKKRKR